MVAFACGAAIPPDGIALRERGTIAKKISMRTQTISFLLLWPAPCFPPRGIAAREGEWGTSAKRIR